MPLSRSEVDRLMPGGVRAETFNQRDVQHFRLYHEWAAQFDHVHGLCKT